MKKITSDDINRFLMGHDPMEHIISIECTYMDDTVFIIYRAEDGTKRVKLDDFKPFLWAKNSVCIRMFDGKRGTLKRKLNSYGIGVKALTVSNNPTDEVPERLANGYKYLFYAKRKMSYAQFNRFFDEAGTPIYEKKKKPDDKISSREFLSVPPVEQYMIATGKRLFKGYDNYDDLVRLQFDIETQGLNPRIHALDQIGIRTNKGYEKIITITGEGEERKKNELKAMDEFLSILAELKPDVIAGHNSENFDWDFFFVRAKVLGSDFSEMSLKYFKHAIFKKKKEAVLKLGGEVEYYHPTIMWGHSIIDSLHAARRAQAIDSNMKSSNLKYVTQYLKLKKENRVYVPGNDITTVWNEQDEHSYAFNNNDGSWYKITEEKPLREGYEYTSGKYIVERYLLDDIWETDKIELKLNESNFLVGKMIPTTFARACTMGTAAIWKLIMLAWSYENDLAIPATAPNKKFTGGLSRLLKTGYVDRIVKLDYNSLYPSVILTWNISTPLDILNAMLAMLNYILTEREKYKELKADAGEKCDEIEEKIKFLKPDAGEKTELKHELTYWKSEKMANDKKQLPLKVLANSFFGSLGCPAIFPWGSLDSAEMTTCTSRQLLRLMISHFKGLGNQCKELGYEPIVGDTDGFNFQMPKTFRYTEEHPYISDGRGRNSVKGKAYVGVAADVAEFEDNYLNTAFNGGTKKFGLGIDEWCDACIQFSRKNYADLMPDGSVKLVGNTIKSRRMSGYLEEFITRGINLLLHNNGSQFLTEYYDYIERIYNYQIPVKDIASKGKIKKTLDAYIKDCSTLTKAGTKKSRQAWYELAINNHLDVNISDTIYYINTGSKKSEASDVKKVSHKFAVIDGQEVEIKGKVTRQLLEPECEKEGIPYKNLKTKEINERLKKYITRESEEIILNCKLVPTEVINDEKDILCSELESLGYPPIEYNVDKYIDQFNKRVIPLLVCFSPEIRDKILITNPDDRNYFTKEESMLVAGYPNKQVDQDTYEALMTPERKEIEYWLKVGQTPPYVKECGQDWDKLVSDYLAEKESESNELFEVENKKYLEALEALTLAEKMEFEEEGKIPSAIDALMMLDSETMRLHFKKIPEKTPSTGGFIFDDISVEKYEVEHYEG